MAWKHISQRNKATKTVGVGEEKLDKTWKKVGESNTGGLHKTGRLEPSANYAPYWYLLSQA